jgi:hypothetical protein
LSQGRWAKSSKKGKFLRHFRGFFTKVFFAAGSAKKRLGVLCAQRIDWRGGVLVLVVGTSQRNVWRRQPTLTTPIDSGGTCFGLGAYVILAEGLNPFPGGENGPLPALPKRPRALWAVLAGLMLLAVLMLLLPDRGGWQLLAVVGIAGLGVLALWLSGRDPPDDGHGGTWPVSPTSALTCMSGTLIISQNGGNAKLSWNCWNSPKKSGP